MTDLSSLASGVLAGRYRSLAQAISLVERDDPTFTGAAVGERESLLQLLDLDSRLVGCGSSGMCRGAHCSNSTSTGMPIFSTPFSLGTRIFTA